MKSDGLSGVVFRREWAGGLSEEDTAKRTLREKLSPEREDYWEKISKVRVGERDSGLREGDTGNRLKIECPGGKITISRET